MIVECLPSVCAQQLELNELDLVVGVLVLVLKTFVNHPLTWLGVVRALR